MPNYRTWTAPVANATKKKKARKYAKRLPRDPKKMYRWAARGTEKDYAKLRDLAAKARHSLPAHIDGEAFERIAHVDRLRLIEEIQAAEQHDISAGGSTGCWTRCPGGTGSGPCRLRSPASTRRRATGSTT